MLLLLIFLGEKTVCYITASMSLYKRMMKFKGLKYVSTYFQISMYAEIKQVGKTVVNNC